MPTRYSDVPSGGGKAQLKPREVGSPAAFGAKDEQAEREKVVDYMKGQLREKRVHPKDTSQKPDTYEGYL